jgi:hypothetical protein
MAPSQPLTLISPSIPFSTLPSPSNIPVACLCRTHNPTLPYPIQPFRIPCTNSGAPGRPLINIRSQPSSPMSRPLTSSSALAGSVPPSIGRTPSPDELQIGVGQIPPLGRGGGDRGGPKFLKDRDPQPGQPLVPRPHSASFSQRIRDRATYQHVDSTHTQRGGLLMHPPSHHHHALMRDEWRERERERERERDERRDVLHRTPQTHRYVQQRCSYAYTHTHTH